MDPLTLAGVGTLALAEGVKFLYGQAAELLEQWRDRRDEEPDGTADLSSDLPDAVGGGRLEAEVKLDRVADHSERLAQLCGQVGNYANGIAAVTDDDRRAFELTAELRDTLEQVIGQHITFVGEDRLPTGTPVVSGQARAGVVKGTADGVSAETVSGNVRVDGRVEADEVAEGGSISGVRLGRADGSSPPGDDSPRG